MLINDIQEPFQWAEEDLNDDPIEELRTDIIEDILAVRNAGKLDRLAEKLKEEKRIHCEETVIDILDNLIFILENPDQQNFETQLSLELSNIYDRDLLYQMKLIVEFDADDILKRNKSSASGKWDGKGFRTENLFLIAGFFFLVCLIIFAGLTGPLYFVFKALNLSIQVYYDVLLAVLNFICCLPTLGFSSDNVLAKKTLDYILLNQKTVNIISTVLCTAGIIFYCRLKKCRNN